jgi:hypothetical protein
MNEGFVDLHVHTCNSDGTFTSTEVLERAESLHLRAVGIADHDSTQGIEEAVNAGMERQIEVVPAVELSCTIYSLDIHILGYYPDYKDPAFLKVLSGIRKERFNRAVKMVEKLKGMGVDLSMTEVERNAGGGSVGRPHIAEALVKNGYVQDFGQAFVRYIGYHSPAYVPKMEMSPKDAFDLIKSVGGIPVFAHPGTVGRDELVPEFVRLGLEGIEVWHTKHDPATSRRLAKVAASYGLLMTGGSDCHGHRQDGPLLGKVKVPYRVLEELKSAKENIAAL